MQTHPQLYPDAIHEALFEIRFESGSLDEFGTLSIASDVNWHSHTQRKLSAYEIPSFIREQDQNLRYQPIIEIIRNDSKRCIRVGANVFSYHIISDYSTWENFRREVENFIYKLSSVDDFRCIRLGLRYLNIFYEAIHGVGSLSDLEVNFQVSGGDVTNSSTLTYHLSNSQHIMQTKLSSPNFFKVDSNESPACMIDIDIFTKDNHQLNSGDDIINWFDQARAIKNDQFFGLLSGKTIEKLTKR